MIDLPMPKYFLIIYRVPKHRPRKSRDLFQSEWIRFFQVSDKISIVHKGPFDFQGINHYCMIKHLSSS